MADACMFLKFCLHQDKYILQCVTLVEEKHRRTFNLVKDGVLGLEACAGKLDNLLIGARLLPTKLVAWKSQNLKAYKPQNW